MMDSGAKLAFFFFCYAFLGWLLETAMAALRHHQYENRGVISGPFCLIYGFSAVALTVFFQELKASPVFLFLGCALPLNNA